MRSRSMSGRACVLSRRITILSVGFFLVACMFQGMIGQSDVTVGPMAAEGLTNISALTSDASSLTLSFETGKMSASSVTTEHGSFTVLASEGMGHTTDVGKPQLPYTSRLVALPDVDVHLQVLRSDDIETRLPRIIPSQDPGWDDEVCQESVFSYDALAYATDRYYPERPVRIEDSGVLRGVPFVRIGYYPVQYNPVTGEAIIHSDVEVRISWNENAYETDARYISRPYEAYFRNTFVNWEQFRSAYATPQARPIDTARSPTGCEYLIITDPLFTEAANELAEWKIRKGIDTWVVDTTVSGNTTGAIQAYLQNAYDTWAPAPSYVLFFGDAEHIPTNYVYMHPSHIPYKTGTDLWYVTLDGPDYYPDMHMGRIPVDTAFEASNFIAKVIDYEVDPPTNAGFYANVTIASYFQDNENDGYESRRFVRTSEEARDYLLTQGFSVERIYTTGDSINPTNYNNGVYGAPVPGAPIPAELLRSSGFAWDGDADDIINAADNGSFMLVHRDHGARTAWGHPYFSRENDIPRIDNGDLLPVVFSVNCRTGWFDSETDEEGTATTNEVFCEKFLRKVEGGTVGLFGATRNSKSGYNDYMMRGYMDALWPDFDTSQGGPEPMYSMGELLDYGKSFMANTWGDPWGNEMLEFELFHYFGDPTMEIWTGVPGDLVVSHPSWYPIGSTQVAVDVDQDDTLVSIVQDNVILGTNYSIGGQAIIDVNPLSGGFLYVTVTKHNFRPYRGIIIVPFGDHDVGIDELDVPLTGVAGTPVDIGATLLNLGMNDESDITVQLKVDGGVVNSTVIGSLTFGNLTRVGFSWTPPVGGMFDVEVHSVPVPSEAVTNNNQENDTILVDVHPDVWLPRNGYDFTLPVGQTDSDNLTIVNSGLGGLEFEVIWEWLNVDNVLVLTDDYPMQYPLVALENLGLPYYNVTTWWEFNSLLTSGIDWDLVIVNAYSSGGTPWQLLGSVNDYLTGGGKMIYNDWGIGTYYPTHTLLDTLCFSYVSGYKTPLNVYKWNDAHQIFNSPNAVPDLQWTHNEVTYDGNKGNTLPPGEVVAGYTSSQIPGEDALIINGTQSVFHCFQPPNFRANLDGDAKPDMIELYENEIYYLLSNGSSGLDWLSFSPDSGLTPSLAQDNVTLTVNTSALVPGFYQARLLVTHNDPGKGPLTVYVNLTVAEATGHLISVHEGWNLISTPLIPDDQALPGALLDADGDTFWTRLQYYDPADPTDPWKTYDTFKPASLNDLSEVDETMGLWLYIEAGSLGDGYINATGLQPTSTPVNLKAGWNLVGYPSITPRAIQDALAGTGYDAPVEGFNATAPYRTGSLADTYAMQPGEGYWVHVPFDTVWVVDW